MRWAKTHAMKKSGRISKKAVGGVFAAKGSALNICQIAEGYDQGKQRL